MTRIPPRSTLALLCALDHVPADKIVVAPDCGMKYRPRDVAFDKLQAMVAGAALVREDIAAPQ